MLSMGRVRRVRGIQWCKFGVNQMYLDPLIIFDQKSLIVEKVSN